MFSALGVEQPAHGYQFPLTAVLPIPSSEALVGFLGLIFGFNLQGSCAAVVSSVPMLVFSGVIVQR